MLQLHTHTHTWLTSNSALLLTACQWFSLNLLPDTMTRLKALNGTDTGICLKNKPPDVPLAYFI